jgi:hypothetical protein
VGEYIPFGHAGQGVRRNLVKEIVVLVMLVNAG